VDKINLTYPGHTTSVSLMQSIDTSHQWRSLSVSKTLFQTYLMYWYQRQSQWVCRR